MLILVLPNFLRICLGLAEGVVIDHSHILLSGIAHIYIDDRYEGENAHLSMRYAGMPVEPQRRGYSFPSRSLVFNAI